MAAAKARQRNLIQSLAGVVGLDGEADPFEVLKGVAETLGMAVAEDGTATLPEVGQWAWRERVQVCWSMLCVVQQQRLHTRLVGCCMHAAHHCRSVPLHSELAPRPCLGRSA